MEMINIQCKVVACCAADPSWCFSVSFSFLTPLSSSLSLVFSACVCSHSFSRSSLITVSCHNRVYQHSWCFAIRAVNEIFSQYFHTFSPCCLLKAPATDNDKGLVWAISACCENFREILLTPLLATAH